MSSTAPVSSAAFFAPAIMYWVYSFEVVLKTMEML